ncbi:MAG: hypothetical protein SCH71_15715 [Desulfobulbaceae bacterium]|nr:hypothetical protein [Desulfobulbaceae bacterium]
MSGIFTTPCSGKTNSRQDASWKRTVELYSLVPGLTEEQREYGRRIISSLNYNNRRVFRKMCTMPGIDFEHSLKAWARLQELDLSYEQVLSFEEWSELRGTTADLALAALPEIKTLEYEAGRSFRGYCRLPQIRAENALHTIPLLVRFDDAQNKAAQSLFAVRGIHVDQALSGMGAIAVLRDNQARVAEAYCAVPGMAIQAALDALPLLAQLHQDDAWNARALFLDSSMSPEEAWFWITGYFATPPEIQENQFYRLTLERRQILLKALYDAGEELIWKINNLHAVTDRFGLEISNYELQGYSTEEIKARFSALSPLVISRYAENFYGAAQKTTLIAILKEATALERVETGRRMTSANIYALLSQGSQLYDSSFRDILVPILKKRITDRFAGNLLLFLNDVDAGNQFVSDFVVSLAQKGKLTAFFPENTKEQEQILDLVAASAFEDEDSIILFSATFMHLLEVLQPAARSFLIDKMRGGAESGTAIYARLITVILQYYLQEFPDLLLPEERSSITSLMAAHGATNLHRYLTTPFAQWKSDGALSSISVFHPDDDGRNSFRSFAAMLLKSGYIPQLSDDFTVRPLSEGLQAEVKQIIGGIRSNNPAGLSTLFSSMYRNSYAVSFARQINKITVTHSTFVYNGGKDQEILMERFILNGTEMFAQRGHSYWRSEQIMDPLHELMQSGKVSEADLEAQQRFLSLGSCGGVKAYTRLDHMFLGNVDILATIGTGLAGINDPYNKNFFEVIAGNPSSITWKDVAEELAFIFKEHGRDYLQPGSLPAILHKIMNEERKLQAENPPDRGETTGSDDMRST